MLNILRTGSYHDNQCLWLRRHMIRHSHFCIVLLFASESLENLEEISLRHYMQIDVCSSLKALTTEECSRERVN